MSESQQLNEAMQQADDAIKAAILKIAEVIYVAKDTTPTLVRPLSKLCCDVAECGVKLDVIRGIKP